MQQNLMASLKQGAANGQLAGGYGYAPNQWYLSGGSLGVPVFGQRVDTWEDLMAIMQPGDVANIGPGFYAEGNLIIPETLSNITLRGLGNRGAMGIEAPVTGDEGLLVLADDVTLINLGVAGGDTGDYSLQVGSQTVSPARFRAYGCKFENAAIAVRLYGCGDTILDDCEICWTTRGIVFRSNDNGFVTQTRIKNCLLHNYVTAGLAEHAAAQQVNDLWVVDNVFGRQEDGTAGTDDILLSDNLNTGFITGNRFPRATNGTGFITIGTGLIYNPNGTEAGWSTARPA